MLLQGLSPQLQCILDAELVAGNSIAEVSSWPPKCSLLIILKHPFHCSHLLPDDVEYFEINDPHYWKSEFRYKDGWQIIACRFG